MSQEKKNLEAICALSMEAFGKQGGKPRGDWTHADWMEFLNGWQHARFKNAPGPDTKIRRLGLYISALLMDDAAPS